MAVWGDDVGVWFEGGGVLPPFKSYDQTSFYNACVKHGMNCYLTYNVLGARTI